MAIHDWTQSPAPLLSLKVGRSWGWKFQPSNHLVGSPGNQLLSLGAFQRWLHYHKFRCTWKGLVMNDRVLLLLLRLQNYSVTYDKTPNITKDTPISLMFRRFQEFWELWSMNSRWRLNICYYKASYHTCIL